MKNIILATRNPSKAEQIRAIFAGSPFNVQTLNDLEISGEGLENGDTLEENAYLKARFAWEQQHPSDACYVLADDTGICINALDGRPGHRSARWAGEDAETDEIAAYTLKQIAGAADRTAFFRTAVVVISPNGKVVRTFHGEVKGTLLEAPRVRPQKKMPYSAIFKPDGSNKVWAEMSVDEENLISHRGQAFRKALEFLKQVAV